MNRLKKIKKFSCSSISKTKKKFFRYEVKIIQEIKTSSAGNRTPVSNVTGWDTHHYTTEDHFLAYLPNSCHLKFSSYRMTQYNSISVQESCCIQQHEIRSFFEKSSFFSSQHSPSKKLGAESHVCKLSETKFKALNQLKKKNFM